MLGNHERHKELINIWIYFSTILPEFYSVLMDIYPVVMDDM